MKKEICKLLDISDVSYYRWKQDRPIIPFLEKYFTDLEITEFIESGKIERLELIKDKSVKDLKKIMDQKVDNDAFCYSTGLFKIKSLNIREKAILYHSINEYLPFNKVELIGSINKLELTKKAIQQVINTILLRKFSHKFDEKIGYDFDRNHLILFIEKYLSDVEIELFLKNPDFT